MLQAGAAQQPQNRLELFDIYVLLISMASMKFAEDNKEPNSGIIQFHTDGILHEEQHASYTIALTEEAWLATWYSPCKNSKASSKICHAEKRASQIYQNLPHKGS